MDKEYDYVIIGSGFGGSVSALRLSEKGYKVLVIEQGKEFKTTDFPETNWNLKKWLWLPSLKFFGIQKLTFFRHVTIMSGTGVGGGSLVYANTLPKPKSPFFNHGSWNGLNDWENKLSPFYEKAWKMLGATVNPVIAPADKSLKNIANEMGKHFEAPKVAIYFGDKGETVKAPYYDGKGPDRTGCELCGACMTGCKHDAKNTLDKNYLFLAKQLGAEILAEHKGVDVIANGEKGENGYEIVYKSSTSYFASNKTLKTKGIIFSGGVLGTIPLLLKLKESSLPNLSDNVGNMVRTNNESLTLNTVYSGEYDGKMSQGIAIGSIMEIDENSHVEAVRYGKGSGFFSIAMVPVANEPNFFLRFFKVLFQIIITLPQRLKILFTKDFASNTSVLLFMQHLDSTIQLKRGLFGLKSSLNKNEKKPTAFIPEALNFAKAYSKKIKAIPQVMFTESITGFPSTAHILGGACMGESKETGVIDKNNKVFNYENMYVFDGSMISANPGVNPALSITAISEYGMSKIKVKGDSSKKI
jgi:cholesterol oxidase